MKLSTAWDENRGWPGIWKWIAAAVAQVTSGDRAVCRNVPCTCDLSSTVAM